MSLSKTLFPLLLMTSYCLAQSGGLLNATRGIPQPNDPSGTTLYSTAIVNAAGNAATAQIGNTTVPVRIVIGGAGTTGNAVLASTGTLAPCTMDATLASAGNAYVIESVLNPGQCHPQTATPGPGTWVIGYVHDPATTSGQTALVHVNGFIYGGGGGLPAGMSYTAPTLTLAASGGVGGTLALGGSTSGTGTIVAPSIPGNTNAQFAFSSGINFPTNAIITWGNPTVNLAIGRAQSAFLQVGNSGTSLNENGFIGTANACAIAAAAAFSPGSNADVCYRNLPLVSRSWIVQCVFPYTYTAGTGSTTVTFNVVINNAPSAASTFVSNLWSPSTAPVYQTATLSASGATPVFTTTTTLPDANIYTLKIDGVVNAPGGGGLNLRGIITTGTAQILSGGYCRYE